MIDIKEYKIHKNKEFISIDMSLSWGKEDTNNYYKKYMNPQLANLLNLLGLTKHFVEAQGTKVWDERREVYTDFLGAYGSLNIGHNNEYVIKSLEKVKATPNLLQTFINPITTALAINLATIAPGNLQHTFFCNSGAEAVEGALKLAKIATGKSRIVYCKGSFHGKSLGALSVTGRNKYKQYFGPLVPLSQEVTYGCIDELHNVLKKYNDISAFIVEPIQGEGGIIVPPKGYLKKAEALCKQHKVLLIIDEVQTGFGRTGYWFSSDEENVYPDILCMAKSLGGGVMPIGAYITTQEVWNKGYGSLEKCLLHTSTFGGNTWASAAAIATLEYIQQHNLVEETKIKGGYLLKQLQVLKDKYPLLKEVRGKGLMIGLEFHSVKDNRFFNKFLKGKTGELLEEYVGGLIATELLNNYNIITAYTLNNPNVIRIEPPLTISYEELDGFVYALENILKKYKGVTALAINNFKNIFQSTLRRS